MSSSLGRVPPRIQTRFLFTRSWHSQNLVRLQLEATAVKKQDRGDHYCQHEGKTCTQNCVRGFVKAFVVGFGIKYLIGLLPLVISGKIFKR